MTKECMRKCVGCNELKARQDLIKITVEHSTNELYINPNSKTFGRSAYLCYNQSCIEQALKKRKINRALKIAANIDLKGLLNGQLKG